MATLKQNAITLWDAHATVSRELGLNIDWGSAQDRVPALAADVMMAGLVGALVDAGVLTDEQVSAAFDAVKATTFPTLPPSVPGPNDDQTVPDPDLGE